MLAALTRLDTVPSLPRVFTCGLVYALPCWGAYHEGYSVVTHPTVFGSLVGPNLAWTFREDCFC